jgi:hypothetical protein
MRNRKGVRKDFTTKTIYCRLTQVESTSETDATYGQQEKILDHQAMMQRKTIQMMH